jgi:hypothetical protein
MTDLEYNFMTSPGVYKECYVLFSLALEPLASNGHIAWGSSL